MKFSTLLFVIALTGGLLFLLFAGNRPTGSTTPETANVFMEDDIQIIEITAKGGYSPRVTEAKANVPTELRMITENTYDCSSALVIPDLSYSGYLPFSGITEIEIPAQEAGTTLQGLCSMGMFQFQIEFVE